MQVITIGSVVYLGTIKEDEKKGTSIIENSLCLGNIAGVTKDHLSAYLQAENVKQLEKPITIKGAGVMVSVRDLADDLALEFEILKLRMKQAESIAVAEIVNAKFVKIS